MALGAGWILRRTPRKEILLRRLWRGMTNWPRFAFSHYRLNVNIYIRSNCFFNPSYLFLVCPERNGLFSLNNHQNKCVFLPSFSPQVLDRLVLYLRIVHSIDYYNTCEYPSEDEMPNRCGMIHVRGPIPPNRITHGEGQFLYVIYYIPL